MDNLLHWLRDEASDKQGRSIDTAGWTRKYPLVPQQQNTNDCGVFALVFANYICISRKFDFDHKVRHEFQKVGVGDGAVTHTTKIRPWYTDLQATHSEPSLEAAKGRL